MKSRLLFAPCALLLAAGCQAPAVPPPAAQEPELIAGFDAKSPTLDAVGSLGVFDPDGHFYVLCTGTLIGPHTVLTARHCGVTNEPVFFAVGPEASHAREYVPVVTFQAAPLSTGGAMGLGSDVGVYQLASSLDGKVQPFAVAATALTEADVGHKFVSIGFGVQSNSDGVFGPLNGTRKAGTGTLQALRGKLFELMLGDLSSFLAYVAEQLGQAYVDANLAELTAYYDGTTLLEGYEAFVGNATGDSQTCFGDSGSPLLRKGSNGALEALGVVSGGIGSAELICDKGGVYAIFGESTQSFLAGALTWVDPCAGVTVEGSCEGTVATRCTTIDEGPRRVVAFDCADLNQVCGQEPGATVACVDPLTR